MKASLLLLFFTLFFMTAEAQVGNNQIGLGAELGIPMGDLGRSTRPGPGGSLKILYGLGMQGQAGITAGYFTFGARDDMAFKTSSQVIPILATYRQHLDGLYLEPQLGVSMIRSKLEGAELGSQTSSTTALGWAVGAGYLIGGLDLSLRYQSASRDGGSRGFVGVRAGYNFSL